MLELYKQPIEIICSAAEKFTQSHLNDFSFAEKLKNADSGVDKGDKDCQTIPKQIKLGLILQYTNDLG